MSTRVGTADFVRSNPIKQTQPERKPGTAKSLYSGISSAQRAIQQQRHRYFGSASLWPSKRDLERANLGLMKKWDPPVTTYHPWESDYSKLIIRERRLKPMTKDPYTSMSRLVTHVVEKMTTEAECYPTLISAKAVKIQTIKIREAPKEIIPTTMRIHYLRRNELMPSERVVQLSQIENASLTPQTELKTPIISLLNVNKTIGMAPTLATTNRLLNRAKMRSDSSAIRKPARKLIVSAAQETIMPLTVYG